MSVNCKTIGHCRSPFREKFGTPRQSAGICKYSRGYIQLHHNYLNNIKINKYDKLILIWIFHSNNNLKFRSKIRPPRLNGERLGVFSTRTPHRPNPIGISIIVFEKYDTFDNTKLWVNGLDLIDYTPILQILPYSNVIAENYCNFTYPQWLVTRPHNTLKVEIHANVIQKMNKLNNVKFEFYENINDILLAIKEVVSFDPRTVQRRKKCKSSDSIEVFGFLFDQLDIVFITDKNDKTIIVDIKYYQMDEKRENLQSKDWYQRAEKFVEDLLQNNTTFQSVN